MALDSEIYLAEHANKQCAKMSRWLHGIQEFAGLQGFFSKFERPDVLVYYLSLLFYQPPPPPPPQDVKECRKLVSYNPTA